MSQEARELSARFAHLLQPIRDLTKNWDIDVAAQLEEYLEEIEQITITFDGQNSTMDFAEAALLIQGSTCVYSKKARGEDLAGSNVKNGVAAVRVLKGQWEDITSPNYDQVWGTAALAQKFVKVNVEYLYSLVYQTLDLIASKKKLAQSSSVDAQGKDQDVSFAQKNDEFLTLDMVEAHNIDMDERPCKGLKTGTCQIVPRTPMSLIPLQDTERATSTPLLSRKGEVLGSRVDFMMNTGAMHSSGALLLEPVNHLMLTAKVTDRDDPISLHYDATPLNKIKEMLESQRKVPSMPEDDDAHLFEVDDDDNYAGDAGVGGDYGGTGAGDDHHSYQTSPTRDNNRRNRSRRVCIQEEEKTDPWTLLDPHEKTSSENKPLRKGVTYKILSCLVKNEGRKRKKKPGTNNAAMESLSTFLHRTVYSCSSIFPKNPLKAPQSSEFEGYYWAEAKKRLQQKKQDNLKLVQLHREHALQVEQQAMREEEADQDDLDDYQPLGDCDDDDDRGGGVMLADMEAGFQGALDNYAYAAEGGLIPDPQEQLATLAGLGGSTFQGVEPMALDELSGRGPLSYEDLVKNYVEGTMEGVQTYMHETDLGKRVEQWEEKIRPILATEEEYPMFDIHAYGSTVIQELKEKEKVLKFSDIAKNKKHYDVSRLFAASLQLANNYNLEITCEGKGEEAVDTMTLTLLNPALLHTQLSNYKAPSLLSNNPSN